MREDLGQLGPEALAAMTNWGLVKRAQNEIANGQGPTVDKLADQSLRACFPDGTQCVLPQGQPWTASRCSCGASMCRHRIALVLALPRQPSSGEGPLHLDLEAVRSLLGPRLWERACGLKQKGMQAELLGPPWQVRLPTNTVRFLSGSDVSSARCDCELAWPCEHLALAAWVVAERASIAGRVDWSRSLAEVQLDLEELWQDGCLATLPAPPPGCTWLHLLLEEMTQLQQAYRDGSSHYDSEQWLFCALSLWCRTRARGECSAEYRLGRDLPMQQELEQTRLVSLGATRDRDGTNLYFCDPAGLVMRLPVAWGKTPGGGLRLPELAYGQLISRGVVRRANRTFRLRREHQRHSLSPLGDAWNSLPEAVLWPGWAGWRRSQAKQPTRLLRPWLECEDFVVMEVGEVVSICYLPGSQKMVAHLLDGHGQSIRLERTHKAHAPAALDVLMEQLGQARRVSGLVHSDSGRAVLEPVALWTDRLHILDLEQAPADWDVAWLVESEHPSPLRQLLKRALELCSETLHLGRSQLLPSFDSRRQQLASLLEEAGWLGLAQRLSGPWDQETFWAFALRVYLALEQLALVDV